MTETTTKLLSEIVLELRKLNSHFENEKKVATIRHTELVNLISRQKNSAQLEIVQVDEPNSAALKLTELEDLHYDKLKNEVELRSRAFCSFYKNKERSRIYRDYIKLNPPFIPPKCREKLVRGQSSAEWRNIQKEREIHNTEHEIKKLEVFSQAAKQKLEKIDNEVMTLSSQLPPDKRNSLTQMWESTTLAHEERIKKQWMRNKKFLETLPSTSPRQHSPEDYYEAHEPSYSRGNDKNLAKKSEQKSHSWDPPGGGKNRQPTQPILLKKTAHVTKQRNMHVQHADDKTNDEENQSHNFT